MRGLPLAATDGQSVAVEVAGRPTEAKPRAGLQSQNNLGTALWTLGERENGTELLLEAVEAYRDALKERTRERVPLQWAATQNNLGNAETPQNGLGLSHVGAAEMRSSPLMRNSGLSMT